MVEVQSTMAGNSQQQELEAAADTVSAVKKQSDEGRIQMSIPTAQEQLGQRAIDWHPKTVSHTLFSSQSRYFRLHPTNGQRF